jgi:hypothetical protein
MRKEREVKIKNLFRQYRKNKKELETDYNIPVPSAIAYDRIKIQADASKNVAQEFTVEYISRREQLFKSVYVVEEVLRYFRLEGHGRERFITVFLIDGASWVKTERVCAMSFDTISRWKRDVFEKAEMVGKWINYF